MRWLFLLAWVSLAAAAATAPSSTKAPASAGTSGAGNPVYYAKTVIATPNPCACMGNVVRTHLGPCPCQQHKGPARLVSPVVPGFSQVAATTTSFAQLRTHVRVVTALNARPVKNSKHQITCICKKLPCPHPCKSVVEEKKEKAKKEAEKKAVEKKAEKKVEDVDVKSALKAMEKGEAPVPPKKKAKPCYDAPGTMMIIKNINRHSQETNNGGCPGKKKKKDKNKPEKEEKAAPGAPKNGLTKNPKAKAAKSTGKLNNKKTKK